MSVPLEGVGVVWRGLGGGITETSPWPLHKRPPFPRGVFRGKTSPCPYIHLQLGATISPVMPPEKLMALLPTSNTGHSPEMRPLKFTSAPGL